MRAKGAGMGQLKRGPIGPISSKKIFNSSRAERLPLHIHLLGIEIFHFRNTERSLCYRIEQLISVGSGSLKQNSIA